jgi:DNA repair protein RadC
MSAATRDREYDATSCNGSVKASAERASKRSSLLALQPASQPQSELWSRQRSQLPSKRVRRLVTLRLVREGSFAAPEGYGGRAVPIRSARDVYDFMAPYAAREVCESFWILPLDSQHRVARAGPVVITRGILNSSLVHAREVFVAAILSSAAALILVHNHPSGDPTPSRDDRAVTDALVSAGKLLGIEVLDHVIMGSPTGSDRCTKPFASFAEQGLL